MQLQRKEEPAREDEAAKHRHDGLLKHLGGEVGDRLVQAVVAFSVQMTSLQLERKGPGENAQIWRCQSSHAPISIADRPFQHPSDKCACVLHVPGQLVLRCNGVISTILA